MRQSIRALGWTITICMILLFVFLVTAVYSAFQTVLMAQGLGLDQFQISFSDSGLVLSMPMTINNTGYYDMSDFKITTTLKDYNGTTLTAKSTIIEEIKKGSTEFRLHNLSLSLTDILSNMTYLLFHDTEFKMDFSIGFKYAYTLSFQLGMMNMSMPWEAPLYGLNVTDLDPSSFNGTHLLADITLGVENHSFFDIAGNLTLKVYNEMEGYLGSGIGLVHVPSGSRFSERIETVIEIVDPLGYTGEGYVEGYLELPMIDHSFELGRLDYG
jgi:hypothetical protein